MKLDKLFKREKDNLENLALLYRQRIGLQEMNLDLLKKKSARLQEESVQVQLKIDDDKRVGMNLQVRDWQPKLKTHQKLWYWVTGKKVGEDVTGYIFYLDKNYNMRLFETKDNIDNVFKLKMSEGEAYNLHRYFGLYNKKRFFLVKFPYAISLDLVQEEIEPEDPEDVNFRLAFDSKAYYNLLEHTIKRNITKGEGTGTNITDTLIKYWWVIVIIAIVAYLTMSPDGKAWMQSLLSG